MAAPPKEFADLAEAKAAAKTLVQILYDNKEMLLKTVKDCSSQQEKMAAILPVAAPLLEPEMLKMGFPKMPQASMALMVGFMTLNKATKFEGGGVIQETTDALKDALMSGNVDTFPYEDLLKKLS